MNKTQLLKDIELLTKRVDFNSDEKTKQRIITAKYRDYFNSERRITSILSENGIEPSKTRFEEYVDWMVKIGNIEFAQLNYSHQRFLNLEKRFYS